MDPNRFKVQMTVSVQLQGALNDTRQSKWTKMINGLHLYSTFTDPMATKALYICLLFTHSYTDSGVSHTRRHPARREQLGLGVLLVDTLTLGQMEPGIETQTFRFVDKLHEPLSHCCPNKSFFLVISFVEWTTTHRHQQIHTHTHTHTNSEEFPLYNDISKTYLLCLRYVYVGYVLRVC